LPKTFKEYEVETGGRELNGAVFYQGIPQTSWSIPSRRQSNQEAFQLQSLLVEPRMTAATIHVFFVASDDADRFCERQISRTNALCHNQTR